MTISLPSIHSLALFRVGKISVVITISLQIHCRWNNFDVCPGVDWRMWINVFDQLLCRYGQTNCFVGTAIQYVVFAVNDKEAYLCTRRAARNMIFQGVVSPREALDVLLEIEGANLVGTGNSLMMFESVTKFGADATRLSLADAGDGIEDANFEEKTANANNSRVHTLGRRT